MSGTTSKHGLIYPVGTDLGGDGNLRAQELAESLDEKLSTRRFSSGLKRISNVAFYDEASPNLTGYVIINTKIPFNNHMCRIDIKGNTYLPYNNVIDLTLTFYAYSVGSTVINTDVVNNGTMQFLDIGFYLRTSDNTVAIALRPDTPSNQWQYARFAVDAFIGHTEITKALTEGWTTVRAATMTGYTLKTAADMAQWRTLAPLGGWVFWGGSVDVSPRYRKVGNMVFVQGLIKNGTNGQACGQLPVGYRPNSRIIFNNWNDTSTVPARVDVTYDGYVIPMGTATSAVSITGIRFPVDNHNT